MFKIDQRFVLGGIALFGFVAFSYFFFSSPSLFYTVSVPIEEEIANVETVFEEEEVLPRASHLDTPPYVRAIYMTSWVAGTPYWRDSLTRLIEDTELNAIIIDIKDYTGRIAFEVNDPLLKEIGSEEVRVSDTRDFLEELHAKGIYTIGRITVFQDPYFAKKFPHLAVQKESNRDETWEDYKGISYIDPGAKEMWEYMVRLGQESYDIGFDELNFDYVRFPSDGPMKDIYYPLSEAYVLADPDYGKAKVVRSFFQYLHENLKMVSAEKERVPVISADLFGMVTTNQDDLNIGQVLEYALPYFDYIAPMVYPSHYPKGFNGHADPNKYPYEIINFSMESALKRMRETTTRNPALGIYPIASTTPQLYTKITFPASKIRPWLQDFDYGGIYGVDEVRAQMQAVYDAGLDSWMLWDAANKYTPEALLSREEVLVNKGMDAESFDSQ